MEELSRHLIDVNPYDELVIGGEKHQCGVTVKAGQKLERGTILATDKDNKAVIFGTQSGEETYKPKYILAEAIDTTDGEDVAIAYDRVTVAADKVIVKEDYELTADDIDELRKRNIFFEGRV